MKVINVIDVNSALYFGIQAMKEEGLPISSRVGDTLEIPCPVATVYKKPYQRVLLNKVRDANPFFHLMEALWILAGRDDVKFLKEFNKRMGEYSDDGKIFNAPYGHRLRTRFYDNGGCDLDQLEAVINILKEEPNSRQAICQIWDTEDLERKTKDKACNMSIAFRIRDEKLCMTVYNRSNDMIWGAYGANVVQFSMIQEYVAAHLNRDMGEYTQISNAFHVYTDGPGGKVWDRLKDLKEYDINPYSEVMQRAIMEFKDMGAFESDLACFFNSYDMDGLEELENIKHWKSNYFKNLVIPMLGVYLVYKRDGAEALEFLQYIKADDWRIACQYWLENRSKT